MKSGVILANAGHFDVEIDVESLYNKDRSPVQARPNVEQFTINGKIVYLISCGRVLNLVSSEGSSARNYGLVLCQSAFVNNTPS